MARSWKWYACLEGEEDECGFESNTREEALAGISREFSPGETVVLIEAQMSQARKWEGADFVPFIRTRDREVVVLGDPVAAALKARATAQRGE